MGRKLHDIQPGEVSLVHRGANKRRFLLAKSGEVEFDETIAKILDEPAADEAEVLERVKKAGGEDDVLHTVSAYLRLRESLSEGLLKAITPAQEDLDDENDNGDNKPTDGDNEDEELTKAASEYESLLKRDFTADQRKDLASSGAALSNGSYPIENVADLKNAIHAVGRGNAPHADIRAHIVKRAKDLGATDQLPDEWKVNKEDGMSETAQAVPVKKEDGSWDLTGVPEENRAAVEAVIKATEDEKAALVEKAEAEKSKADEALSKVDAVEAKIAKAEHVATAKGYENLAKSADELGELLYDIAKAEEDKHLPEGTSTKLTELLKAANEAASDVFKEHGRNGHGGNTDAEGKAKAAAAEIKKADPKLTDAQAIAKAYEADPSLYDEYQKEVA